MAENETRLTAELEADARAWAKGPAGEIWYLNPLLAELDALAKALEPFAAYVEMRGMAMPDETLMDFVLGRGPTLGDCRRAESALAAVRANRDAGPGSRAFAPTTIDGENEEFVAKKVAKPETDGTYKCGCPVQRSDNLKGFCPVHHDPIATTPPPG